MFDSRILFIHNIYLIRIAQKKESTEVFGRKFCLLSCMISGGDFMLQKPFSREHKKTAVVQSEKYDLNVQIFMRTFFTLSTVFVFYR